jgi:hypothetical protein
VQKTNATTYFTAILLQAQSRGRTSERVEFYLGLGGTAEILP